MEVEKRKNKRVMREEEESERVKNKRLKGVEEEDGSDGVPTEEEVEEFFAILRRMRVAVKYFDDKGSGGKEWRKALETAELTVDHRHDVAAGEEDDKPKKKGGEVIINEGFDLNAVAPEAAEGGGA